MITVLDYLRYHGDDGGVVPGVWPPPPGEPLPPMPSITNEQPGPVDKNPLAECWIADKIDLTIYGPTSEKNSLRHRGDFCFRVPDGMPKLDGSPIILTWDLVKYDPVYWPTFFDTYVNQRGYTDLVLSRPQTLNAGKTLEDLIALARVAKFNYGLNLTINAFGGDSETIEDVEVWLDALYTEKLLVAGQDKVCVAWQIDQRYANGTEVILRILEISAWAKPKGIDVTVHWVNGGCCVFDPDTCARWGVCDRWSFQTFIADYVKCHLAQWDQNAPMDQIQSAQDKVLVACPPGLEVCYAEKSAQGQFWWPDVWTELYGCLSGRIAMSSAVGRHSVDMDHLAAWQHSQRMAGVDANLWQIASDVSHNMADEDLALAIAFDRQNSSFTADKWMYGGYLNGARNFDGSVL